MCVCVCVCGVCMWRMLNDPSTVRHSESTVCLLVPADETPLTNTQSYCSTLNTDLLCCTHTDTHTHTHTHTHSLHHHSKSPLKETWGCFSCQAGSCGLFGTSSPNTGWIIINLLWIFYIPTSSCDSYNQCFCHQSSWKHDVLLEFTFCIPRHISSTAVLNVRNQEV